MKKLFLLLILISINSSFAGTLNKGSLQTAASSFISGLPGNHELLLNINQSRSINISNDDQVYLFPLSPKGFIILSDNEETVPVIGYSLSDNFSGTLPLQLKILIQRYYRLVRAKELSDETISDNRRKWAQLFKGEASHYKLNSSVEPLLHTKWAQGEYYNNSCPIDSASTAGNEHVWTGCVATAMAQILKYYEHPVNGIGNKSYNSLRYGLLSADFENYNYKWDLMPDKLDENSSAEEVQAVADLMFHCGVAVNMNYGGLESGTNYISIKSAVQNYFMYSSYIEAVAKFSVGSANWFNIIKKQLDSRNPVYYSVTDTDSNLGHAFVCDGYYENKYIHCNWGWSGNFNGYFALNDLSPARYNFSSGDIIVINFEPVDILQDDVVWNGDLSINRSIESNADVTVTINPGTKLSLGENKYILIRGDIHATGTETDSIKFISDDNNPWGGLQFISNSDSEDDVEFKYCLFKNSTTAGRANIINLFNSGGALLFQTNRSVRIEHCSFINNSSKIGGALAVYNYSNDPAKFLISKNYFYNNSAATGGAVYTQVLSGEISNNIFYKNKADIGGGVKNNGSGEINFINNTFLANEASIKGNSISYNGLSQSLLTNNILWDNNSSTTTLIDNDGSKIDVKFNCIRNGFESFKQETGVTYSFNWEIDPGIEILNGNYYPNDYSSAVNNGDPYFIVDSTATDFTGNHRVFGGRIDIGAIENQNKMADPVFDLLDDSVHFNAYSTVTDSKDIELYNWNNPNLYIEIGTVEYPFKAKFVHDTTKMRVSIEKALPGIYSSTIVIESNLGKKSLRVTASIKKGYEGNVSGIWSEDTIHLTGRTVVDSTDSLIIQPGTIIAFHTFNPLVFHGKVTAVGNSEEPIVFTSIADSLPWRNIYFDGCQRTSILEHCLFTNAGYLPNTTVSGIIEFNNSQNITIKNCRFVDSDYRGAFNIYNSKSITLSKNEFIEQKGNQSISNSTGILIEGNRFIDGSGIFSRNSEIQIKNNLLISCFNDILELSTSDPELENLIIGNVFINCWGGFYTSNGKYKLINNTFANNRFAKYGGFVSQIGDFHIGNNAETEFINCIFYNSSQTMNDSTYVMIEATSQASFINCNLTDGNKSIKSELYDRSNITFEKNIYTDPQFVSDNNFNLLEKSRCIDAGTTDGIEEFIPQTDLDGNPRIFNGKIDVGAFEFQGVVSSVTDNELPNEYSLDQNYPNPFNPTTTIEYTVPISNERSQKSELVSLILYDILGRKVSVLINEDQSPGNYKVVVGTDITERLSSGVYFYKLTAGNFTAKRKMLLLK